MGELIIVIVGCFIMILLLLGLLFPRFGHKVFDWHRVTRISGFDGCSHKGTCDICGKTCLQDSQGNWFEINS